MKFDCLIKMEWNVYGWKVSIGLVIGIRLNNRSHPRLRLGRGVETGQPRLWQDPAQTSHSQKPHKSRRKTPAALS